MTLMQAIGFAYGRFLRFFRRCGRQPKSPPFQGPYRSGIVRRDPEQSREENKRRFRLSEKAKGALLLLAMFSVVCLLGYCAIIWPWLGLILLGLAVMGA
jgi:hypothetical protein